jgi:hypothetical protein
LVSSVLNPKPELRKFSGLREGDVTASIKNNPEARDIVQRQQTDSPPTFQGEVYSPPRQDDFAKQMLTRVGTLMTSVISFYFGTTSIRTPALGDRGPAAGSTANVVAPQVRTSTGGFIAGPNTETDFTITGSGLAGVTQVDAVGPTGAPVVATNLRGRLEVN